MDKVKEIMKQAVKYRFWIALGLSALLPLIGYLIGSGPIQEMAKTETAAIEAAAKDVATYTQPNLPNGQYPPIVKEKTENESKDVRKAWEKLYAVQAPLLKWPEQVEQRFQSWGRKWPENVDRGAVQQTISEYVNVYPKAVDATYVLANPWDPKEGTGIVVVPDKETLLRPAVFDEANPPTLGEVWAAQERLWIQGTLLAAIAKINSGAKNWDNAVVKQIVQMEVGSPDAQDQVSAAKGQAVEAAPELKPTAEAASSTTEVALGTIEAASTKASGSASATGGEEVYHIKTDSQQYTILPVKLVAMVDQNRLQDFLVGLENSPMAIQVIEFELNKPATPVTKPVKGDLSSMMAGGMGGMAYPSGPSASGGMAGYPSAGGGMSGMMGMMAPPSTSSMMGMMGMGGGVAAKVKTGTDVRSKDTKKEREAKEKARREKARAADMYYDVVEVTVYGQARFYNPPPTEPTAEPSTAASPTVEPASTSSVADPGAPSKEAEPKATEAPKPSEPAKPADASKPGTVETPAETTKPASPQI